MDPLFEKNLITTKNAGELSGYTSDYLARLVRSGKIIGRRVGHSWLIDRESLTRFVGQQGDRKVDYARALARAREEEYRVHRSFLRRTFNLSNATTSQKHIGHRMDDVSDMSDIRIDKTWLRGQVFALSVASLVVVSATVMAQAAVLPQVATQAATVARDIASGFNATFGDIPSRIASSIHASEVLMRVDSMHIAQASEDLALPLPAQFNLSSLTMALVENIPTSSSFVFVPTKTYASPHEAIFTAEDMRTVALNAYAHIATPSRIVDSLTHAYIAIGENTHASIEKLFSSYYAHIAQSGIQTLMFAATTRDALATVPRYIVETNFAFADSVSNRYLSLIGNTGGFAYESFASGLTLAHTASSLVAAAPATLNVGYFTQQMGERLVQEGKATKEKDVYVINLAQLGYGKLLGTGTTSLKLKLIVGSWSAQAEQKITAAGGSVAAA